MEQNAWGVEQVERVLVPLDDFLSLFAPGALQRLCDAPAAVRDPLVALGLTSPLRLAQVLATRVEAWPHLATLAAAGRLDQVPPSGDDPDRTA